MLVERARGHKVFALGFCSGIIAGLVAVTPAAGNSGRSARSCSARSPRGLLLRRCLCSPRLGYDDALDAFGVHGVGGMIGAIGTGIVYAPSLG